MLRGTVDELLEVEKKSEVLNLSTRLDEMTGHTDSKLARSLFYALPGIVLSVFAGLSLWMACR